MVCVSHTRYLVLHFKERSPIPEMELLFVNYLGSYRVSLSQVSY